MPLCHGKQEAALDVVNVYTRWEARPDDGEGDVEAIQPAGRGVRETNIDGVHSRRRLLGDTVVAWGS